MLTGTHNKQASALATLSRFSPTEYFYRPAQPFKHQSRSWRSRLKTALLAISVFAGWVWFVYRVLLEAAR